LKNELVNHGKFISVAQFFVLSVCRCILSVFSITRCTFCGITMRKYVEANISQKSQLTIKYAMKMMASATEAIIFMYLGVAAVSNERVWNTWFIILTLTFCLVYRTIGKFAHSLPPII
jgi:solute carrier family 9 (sodium/hydrogen exchanger), member 3